MSRFARAWARFARLGEIRVRLLELRVHVRRLDLRDQFPFLHRCADILVPRLDVAVRARVDDRLFERLHARGKEHRAIARLHLRREHVHLVGRGLGLLRLGRELVTAQRVDRHDDILLHVAHVFHNILLDKLRRRM